MSLSHKLHTLFHTPRILQIKFASSPLFRLLPDRAAVKLIYKNVFGEALDLKDPKTFNEKLQWLKLYNRKPEYTTMVDKHAVKAYVTEKIGEEYIIPTLGVWERFEDIDFDALPDQFVLKCTHGSGDVIICKDKSKLDKAAAKKKLTKALKTNFYKISREWPYKDVPRRIIAEKFMANSDGRDIADFKFYCFNGEPAYMFVVTDRSGDCRLDYFDMDFVHQDIFDTWPNSDTPMKKPETFEQMKELSRVLSAGLPHARIDFYEIDGKIYFGEITFFSSGGLAVFEPFEWDRKLGDLIELPK